MNGQRYGAREAAKALGLTAASLRRQVREGRISARRGPSGWTYSPTEVRLIRRFGAARMTVGQVARALGRSTKTINEWEMPAFCFSIVSAVAARWFARSSVVSLARRLGGRRRLGPDARAEFLSELESMRRV